MERQERNAFTPNRNGQPPYKVLPSNFHFHSPTARKLKPL